MKTINFLDVMFLVVACVGILVFWIAGIHDATEIFKWSFVVAGCSAWASLGMKVIGYFYQKRNPF